MITIILRGAENMFYTMMFSSRERYCKAVRHLMKSEKYRLINRGRDGAGWYVYFSKRGRLEK